MKHECTYCGKEIEPQATFISVPAGDFHLDPCWKFLQEDGENIYEPLY